MNVPQINERTALLMILRHAEGECQNWESGIGSCFYHKDVVPCSPCVAWSGLIEPNDYYQVTVTQEQRIRRSIQRDLTNLGNIP